VRFIEYMHLNNAEPGAWRETFVAGAEIRARVEAAFGPLEPVQVKVPHVPRAGRVLFHQRPRRTGHQVGTAEGADE